MRRKQKLQKGVAIVISIVMILSTILGMIAPVLMY